MLYKDQDRRGVC